MLEVGVEHVGGGLDRLTFGIAIGTIQTSNGAIAVGKMIHARRGAARLQRRRWRETPIHSTHFHDLALSIFVEELHLSASALKSAYLQVADQYAEALKCSFLDENGQSS